MDETGVNLAFETEGGVSWIEIYSYENTGWGEPYVSIGADHNTGEYDTTLDRDQVIALRDALSKWLEVTE